MDLALGVAGQVDHPGQLLRAPTAVLDRLGGDVVPHVLVDPEDGDVLEAGLIRRCRSQDRLDRGPHRPPRRPEPARQPLHRGVLTAQLGDGPTARPHRQQTTGPSDRLVLLHERPDRARRLGAPPAALAPHHRGRLPERRRVDQPHLPPAVAVRDDTTGGAAHPPRGGLHRHGQRALAVAVEIDHAQVVQADQQVATVAVAAAGTAAHVGSGIVEVLVSRRCESPLILGDLDHNHAQPTPRRAALTPPSGTKSPQSEPDGTHGRQSRRPRTTSAAGLLSMARTDTVEAPSVPAELLTLLRPGHLPRVQRVLHRRLRNDPWA